VQLSITGVLLTGDWGFYGFFIALVVVAMVSKLIGCGIPAQFFFKNRPKALKVGIGMISRGEVGLIIAGVAISAQIITQSVYDAIIGMVIVTTILTPILLKRAYDKTPSDVDTAQPKTVEP
jgi:Kef-type K+ transport system membrane component KefB